MNQILNLFCKYLLDNRFLDQIIKSVFKFFWCFENFTFTHKSLNLFQIKCRHKFRFQTLQFKKFKILNLNFKIHVQVGANHYYKRIETIGVFGKEETEKYFLNFSMCGCSICFENYFLGEDKFLKKWVK